MVTLYDMFESLLDFNKCIHESLWIVKKLLQGYFYARMEGKI
jgi:hypothetical protein